PMYFVFRITYMDEWIDFYIILACLCVLGVYYILHGIIDLLEYKQSEVKTKNKIVSIVFNFVVGAVLFVPLIAVLIYSKFWIYSFYTAIALWFVMINAVYQIFQAKDKLSLAVTIIASAIMVVAWGFIAYYAYRMYFTIYGSFTMYHIMATVFTFAWFFIIKNITDRGRQNYSLKGAYVPIGIVCTCLGVIMMLGVQFAKSFANGVMGSVGEILKVFTAQVLPIFSIVVIGVIVLGAFGSFYQLKLFKSGNLLPKTFAYSDILFCVAGSILSFIAYNQLCNFLIAFGRF
ncbi:MAG: hypothetical protein ACI4TX_01750, partial [Christensenellales bacterium]